MNKYNILISSAGRRVSLVRLFIKALKEQNINGLVHAIDIDSNAPALYAADKFQIVSKIKDPGYINQLLKICVENEINLIVPTIDTELHLLSKNVSLFNKKGIQLLVCNEDVNKICNDNKIYDKIRKT